MRRNNSVILQVTTMGKSSTDRSWRSNCYFDCPVNRVGLLLDLGYW